MAAIDSNEHFLTNGFGDRYLYSINGETFNQYGATTVFDERYGTSLFDKNTLYFIVGSDSGLLPHYIESKGVPEGTRYWFIEPQELIDRVAQNAALRSERIQFSTLHDALGKADHQTHLGAAYYAYQEKINIYQSLGANDDPNAIYEGYRQLIKEQVTRFIYHVKVTINVKPHIINQVLNGPHTHTPLMFLYGTFAGKTAVIMAAGPSLDAYMDWVKEHRAHLVVIAISRIARRLRQVGVVPDILVSVDPTSLSFDISKDMLRMQDVLFVFSANATPELIGQWGGRCAYIGVRLPWKTDLNEENCPTEGPSVSNTAIYLAHWLGCDQIVLLGKDCCYSQSGDSYAKGSIEREIGLTYENEFVKVKTNAGEEAYTSNGFMQQIGTLTYQAGLLREAGVRLVTPAASAARIDNVDYVDIDAIEISPLEVPAEVTIRKQYELSQEGAFLERLEDEYRRVLKSIGAVMRMAEKAVGKLLGYDQQQDAAGQKSIVRAVKGLKRKIAKEYVSYVIKNYGWDKFAPISEILEREIKAEGMAREAYRKYFGAYLEAAEEMRDLIADGLRVIEMRKAETSDDPDVDKLIDHWRYFRQHGRAVLWLNAQKHGVRNVTAEQEKAISELVESFQAELEKTDTLHSMRVRQASSIEHSLPVIACAFDDGNKSLLEFVIKALSSHKDDAARVYLWLAQGLKCVLDKQYQDALGWFEKIIDAKDSPTLKMALEQVAFISVKSNDRQNALSALECLAHISEQHQPIYAEALAASGYVDGALQTFEHYLASHPNDVMAMLRKCEILRQLQRWADVEDTANAVLRLDPVNATARRLLREVASGG